MTSSFGDSFRKKREEKGLELKEVAEELNLRKKYLKALEEEQFEEMPAEVYTVGFIKNYARVLDLDAEALVKQYRRKFKKSDEGEGSFSSGISSILWTGIVVLVSLTLVSLGFRLQVQQERLGDSVAEETEEPLKEALERVEAEPEESEENDMHLNQQVESEQLELDVLAVDETWIFVTFDGLRKRELLLQPGEIVSWEAEESIRMYIGNAAGIRLYHDGIQLPPLGEEAEVVSKVITIDDGELLVRDVGRRPDLP